MKSRLSLSIGLFLLGMGILGCRGNPPDLGSDDGMELKETEALTASSILPAPTEMPPPAVTLRTVTPLPTAILTPTSSPAPTADPYESFTINYLADRVYGGGEITVWETTAVFDRFTRYLVSYPSDDLEIYGFFNLPHGDGPFRPIVALHGYIDPEVYHTLDYTTRYADALARSGFAVLHPNLRGYPPSSTGSNLFRVGMAIDTLNLLAILKERAGLPGDPLEKVDASKVGLWGHSMGGGVSLRVLTVSPNVDAAVLYGSMSGNETWNFSKILEWSEGSRGQEELAVPEEALLRISPINFLGRIEAAVSIHHGAEDTLVPLAWSEDLCQRLGDLQLSLSCYTYPGQPHTFRGEGDRLFVQRMIEFFRRELSDAP